MLLCDVDHGLVHDLGLVVARVGGRLVVTAPDGRHVWGTADAAFRAGLTGLDAEGTPVEQCPTTADPFTGVHPVDVEVGRRPVEVTAVHTGSAGARSRSRTAPGRGRRRRPGSRPGRGSMPPTAPASCAVRRSGRVRRRPEATPASGESVAAMSRALFPSGEPPLPEAMPVNGERMDLRYAVGVLMGHRDLVRRLAAGSATTSGP